ncbi:MAG: hypothetical protein PHV34_00005 [Verrucomicrobiae bacterium]|nr:hypothetical protein [Verrucomicrobiae bacterium]
MALEKQQAPVKKGGGRMALEAADEARADRLLAILSDAQQAVLADYKACLMFVRVVPSSGEIVVLLM